MSNNPDELLAAANRAHSEGRLSDAKLLARNALELRPADLEATLLLGVIATKERDFDQAQRLLKQVTDEDPSSFYGPYWLSMVHRTTGNLADALAMAKLAVSQDGRLSLGHNQVGLCHLDSRNWAEAESSFRHAAALAPEVGAIQDNLGRALLGLGRNLEAIKAFRLALKLDPGKPQVHNRLGRALINRLEFPAAAKCARDILNSNPDSVAGNMLLARALLGENKAEEAETHALRAMELAPGIASATTLYATVLDALGRIDEARPLFERSLEVDARQGYAYYALARARKHTTADYTRIEKMKLQLLDRDLAQEHRSYLEYAIGKAYDDLGDYESAMGHFDEANRLCNDSNSVSRVRADLRERSLEFRVKNFDQNFVLRHRSLGSTDELPVFIVGLMRSGTTLAEQILSSHPEVGTVGEQRFWLDNRSLALQPPGNVVNSERLGSLVDEYLALLKRNCPDKFRVVDRTPINYSHLGILHVAFPNARIVHMRRHPVDTCLSMWSTPNATPIEWDKDKRSMVFEYRQYLQIMEHWRSIVPSDRLLEVRYEELVSDQEEVSRHMIEFCGLRWSDACLRPEKNPRSVNTPSVWQVRQPVYQTSKARWLKYKPWLGEFEELLTEDHRL